MMMMIIIACGQWAGERPQIKANDHEKNQYAVVHIAKNNMPGRRDVKSISICYNNLILSDGRVPVKKSPPPING